MNYPSSCGILGQLGGNVLLQPIGIRNGNRPVTQGFALGIGILGTMYLKPNQPSVQALLLGKQPSTDDLTSMQDCERSHGGPQPPCCLNQGPTRGSSSLKRRIWLKRGPRLTGNHALFPISRGCRFVWIAGHMALRKIVCTKRAVQYPGAVDLKY